MEYQKIINLSDNAPNQPTKFRTKDLVEINNDACGTHIRLIVKLNLKLKC